MKRISPIIIGLSGTEVTKEEEKVFKQANPFGFILFDRNLKSEEQVLKLTSSLKALFDKDIYIFIDEEGGRVSRLTKSGLVPPGTFPPAYSFYEIYQKEGITKACEATEQNYFAIGSKLSSLGINGNFAPVADLLHHGAHDIIGNRSFGSEPEIAAKLCKSALAGLKRAGVEGCIKHIPGHGLAKVDSHIGLPIVEESLEFLVNNDFAVFRELNGSCPFAMTAHILYNCLDPKNPITTSPEAIKYIKEHLFKGSLISDDITMEALSGDIVANARNTFEAGCDLILYAQSDLEIIMEITKLFENARY